MQESIDTNAGIMLFNEETKQVTPDSRKGKINFKVVK